MNKEDYFKYVSELINTEKRISKLKQEIQDYINVNESMSTEDLLNAGHKYSELYTLEKTKEKLFTTVAIGYEYVQN